MQTTVQNKPMLFNRKLLPLIKRYITFTGSPLQLFSFIALFISAPITPVSFAHIFGAFFFLLILSNMIISSKYGINETYILSILPVSKKQSVLVRCIHLLLVQTIIFAAMIGLTFIKPLIIYETELYFINRLLTIAVLIISITFSNLLILTTAFKSYNPKLKFFKILIGLLSLFIVSAIAPILLLKNTYLFNNITSNLSITPTILYISIAIYFAVTILSIILAVKNCSLFEIETINKTEKKNTALSTDTSALKPDNIILRLYLKILKTLKVNERVIRLIRKDCKMFSYGFYFLLLLTLLALSFVPQINSFFLFIVYISILATLPCILFVATGDIRASYLIPIKRTDYIKSKLIMCFTVQCTVILTMFIVCLITYQFNIMPVLINNSLKFAFFTSLFVSHALSNIVLFTLIFKRPYKIRAYIFSVIAFLIAILTVNLSMKNITNINHELIIFAGSFIFYTIIMLFTWFITKNKKAGL